MITESMIQKTVEYVRREVPSSRKPDEEYFKHVFGARNFALKLAKAYDANIAVVDMAILLHDIGADAGKGHAKKSAEMAAKYLDNLDIDQETKNEILNCIRKHSMGSVAENLEQQIVQDADGLVFIDDTYKYFYLKGCEKYQTVAEAKKSSLLKNVGMTEKIKTKLGQEMVREILPLAQSWLESQK